MNDNKRGRDREGQGGERESGKERLRGKGVRMELEAMFYMMYVKKGPNVEIHINLDALVLLTIVFCFGDLASFSRYKHNASKQTNKLILMSDSQPMIMTTCKRTMT